MTQPYVCPVSVIVLSRGMTSYLFEQMMDSLRAQQALPAEVFVVDCNDPGDPLSMSLQEDLRSLPGLKLITPQRARSMGHMCNLALNRCNGEYICLVDSCDVWEPEKVARQYECLTQHPDSPACVCNGYIRNELSDDPSAPDSSLIFSVPEENPAHWLTSHQFALASQAMFRHSALSAIGGFDEQLESRWLQDAVIRLAKVGPVRFLPEALFDNAVRLSLCDADAVYRDMKYLLAKDYDVLLRHRKQYRTFQFQLAAQAVSCRLWVQAAIHGVVGFCKSPISTVSQLVRSGGVSLGQQGKQRWRRMRLGGHTQRFDRRLRSLRSGHTFDMPEEYVPLAEDGAIFTLNPATDDHPMQFAFHKTLRRVVIPNHVTVIRYGMFAYCRELESVEIPATVLTIEPHAFQGCAKLQKVIFQPGSQLKTVGAYAFAGCSLLSQLTLSGMVTLMDDCALAGCVSLRELTFRYVQDRQQVLKPLFPVGMNKIHRGLLAGCALVEEVHFPEEAQLVSIEEDAFSGCGRLRAVYLHGQVQHIGMYAFAWCRALSNFTMPHIDAVRSIGEGAFCHCESLLSFWLPFELTTIRKECFSGCVQLKYVKVPKQVIFIDSKAFAGCTDLNQVILTSYKTRYLPDSFDSRVQIDRNVTN